MARSAPLLALLAIDAECRARKRLEPHLADWQPATFAGAIRASLDSLQRVFYLHEQVA